MFKVQKQSCVFDLVCGTQPWRNLVEQHPRKKTFCVHGNRFKRVVKGNETDYLEWPWQVQLMQSEIFVSILNIFLNTTNDDV